MKNLLLSTFLLFCVASNAQNILYSNNFDADGAEGWTLVDNDGNGRNWMVRENNYNLNAWGGGQGNPGEVLSLLELYNGSLFDTWAILPQQDLSFFTGNKLSFSYLKGYFASSGQNNIIEIYAASTPDVADMLANGPIATIILEGDTWTEPPAPVTIPAIDIPSQYNLAEVYFAIVSRNNVETATGMGDAIELTEVSITYSAILGTEDVATRTATKIKQNPVAETLQLQLGNSVNEAKLQLQLYNTSGILIKEEKYSETGVSVSNLAAGMYFVVISDGTATERLKFIKK